jgi:hypothetical protein
VGFQRKNEGMDVTMDGIRPWGDGGCNTKGRMGDTASFERILNGGSERLKITIFDLLGKSEE